jgi:hypothetical protein
MTAKTIPGKKNWVTNIEQFVRIICGDPPQNNPLPFPVGGILLS